MFSTFTSEINMLNINNQNETVNNTLQQSAPNAGADVNNIKAVVLNNTQGNDYITNSNNNNYVNNEMNNLEINNNEITFNSFVESISSLTKHRRCIVCGVRDFIVCPDCKPIVLAGFNSVMSTNPSVCNKIAARVSSSMRLKTIVINSEYPLQPLEIIKRYCPRIANMIFLTDEESYESSLDDFIIKLINARYYVFEDSNFLYLVSKWIQTTVLRVPKNRMTLLARLVDCTLIPDEFEESTTIESTMPFDERYRRNIIINMILQDSQDPYWHNVYVSNFNEYPPPGLYYMTNSEASWSLTKWAEAIWAKVAKKSSNIKDAITDYFVDKLSNKVCNSFKECASKIIVVLADVLFGFIDPFGILEALYEKMLKTCPDDEDATFYQQTWFLKLLTFLTGVIGFLLTCFGISTLESYLESSSLHSVASESAALDVCYNVATYLIPSYFPELSGYDILGSIKPYWEDFLQLFSWTPSRTAAGLLFIMSFMPKCISGVYYKFFGTDEQKGGVLYCRASEHYDKVVMLSQQPGCSANPEFNDHINKALAIIRTIPPSLSQTRGYTWAHNMKKELNKYRGQVFNTTISEANRPVGAWFHFFGESGVGKSQILPLVQKFCVDRFYYRGLPLKGIYSRPNNTVYNNGYRGQEIEVWDEFLNIDDAATRNAIMGETLPKLCPTPYMTQMASLEATNAAGSKGTLCGTRLVLSANNLLDFIGCTFEMESALARRRNLTVEIVVDKEKFGPDHQLLAEWAPYANDPTKLGMKFIVYTTKIVDKTIEYIPTEPVNWEQLCDLMLAKWEYVQKHNTRMGYVSLLEQTSSMIKTEAVEDEPEEEPEESSEDEPDEDVTTIPKGVRVYESKVNLAGVYPYFDLYNPKYMKDGFFFDPVYGFIYSRNAVFYNSAVETIALCNPTEEEKQGREIMTFTDTKYHQINTLAVNDRAKLFYNFICRCHSNDSNANKTLNPAMIMTEQSRVFKFSIPRLEDTKFKINYNNVYKDSCWFGENKFSVSELCDHFMVDPSSIYVAFCDVYAFAFDSVQTLFQDRASEVFNLIALIHLNAEKKVKGMGYDDKLDLDGGYVTVHHTAIKLLQAYKKHLKTPRIYVKNLKHTVWDATVHHPKYKKETFDFTKPSLCCGNYSGTPAITKNFFRISPKVDSIQPQEDEIIIVQPETPQSEAPSLTKQAHGFVKSYKQIKNDKREKRPDDYFYAAIKRSDGWHLTTGTPQILETENGFSIVSNNKELTIGNHLVMKKIEEYEKTMKDTESLNEMFEIDDPTPIQAQDMKEFHHHRKFSKIYRGFGSALRLGLTLYQLYKAISHKKVEEDVESLIYSESMSGKSVATSVSPSTSQSKKVVHYNSTVFDSILADCTLSDSLSARAESNEGWQCILRLDHVPYRCIFLGDKTFLTHRHQVVEALSVATTCVLEINDQTLHFNRSDVVAKQSTTEDLLFIKFQKFSIAKVPVAARFMYLNDLLRVIEKGIPMAYLNSSTTKVLSSIHYVLQQSYNDAGVDKVLKHCLGYTGSSVPGDCGSAIYIERKGKQVIGIHTAGGKIAPTVKKGYATMLFKEKISKYLSQFDEMSGVPVVEAFDIPTLEPLPEDFQYHGKTTTKLVRTEFADLYKDDCKPAVLSLEDPNNVNHIDPYAYTINELVKYKTPAYNAGALARAVEDMRMWVNDQLCKLPPELLDVWDSLSLDEVIAGHGRTELEPINDEVSGGYPDCVYFPSPYSRFEFEKNKPVKLTFEYKNYVVKVMNDLMRGKLDRCYFIANVKDEQQRRAKWLEGRSRLVYEMAQAIVCALKFLFRRTMAFFNKHYEREFCHTLNVHGHDFHNKIYGFLTELGATKFIAGDYKAFDMHVHPVFQREALKILLSVSRQPEYVVDNVINFLMRPTILLPTGSLSLSHGQFSGNIFTSLSNCMINCLYIRYCWYLTTNEPFDDHVRMVVCGDDNVISVTDDYIDKFNGLVIAKRLASLGQTYTSDQKDKPLKPFVPFSEVTFGGAAPMREQDVSVAPGRYVGILTEDRIKASLSWTFDPENAAWLQTALRFAVNGRRESIIDDILNSSYFKRQPFRGVIEDVLCSVDTIRQNTYRNTTKPVVKTESISEVPPMDTVLEIEELSDDTDNDIGEQPPEEVIKNFFYRDTISIATSAGRGSVVYSADIYKLMFTADNLQTQIAKGYQWFRPSPKIEFVYNGQPLTQGLFRAIWVPLVEEDYNFEPDQLFAYDNYIDIKAQRGEHACLKIDYLYNKAGLPVVKGSGGTAEYFGKLFVVVVSPLIYQTGTNMNITIQVSYDDTKFSIPKPPVQTLGVVAESMNFDQYYKTDGSYNAKAAQMPEFVITANTSATDNKKKRNDKSNKNPTIRRNNKGRGGNRGRGKGKESAIPQKTKESVQAVLENKPPSNDQSQGVKNSVPRKRRRNNKQRMVKPKRPELNVFADPSLLNYIDQMPATTRRMEKLIVDIVIASVPIPHCLVGTLKKFVHGLLMKTGDPIEVIQTAISKLGYYDQPEDYAFTNFNLRQPPMAATNYAFPAAPMEFKDPRGVDPLRVDIKGNQASLGYLMGREELVADIPWSDNQPANTALARFWLDGIVEQAIPSKVGIARALLQSFKFARYDLVFKIRVVKNNFQNGALRFIVAYGEYDLNNTGHYRNSSYNEILMAQGEEDEFTVTVPYTSLYQYLRARSDYVLPDRNETNCMGCCSLEVANPLVLSSATVASTVRILVTVHYTNVMLGVTRPILPYYSYDYRSDNAVIQAEALGPGETAEDPDVAELPGEEDDYMVDLVPLSSLIEICRREVLIRPEDLKSSKFTSSAPSTGSTNVTLYVLRTRVALNYLQFFFTSVFRAFRGGFHLRIKTSNPRHTTVSYYPDSTAKQQFYGQYIPMPEVYSGPSSSLPVETLWYGDMLTVHLPFRSHKTFLTRGDNTVMGYVEVVCPSTNMNSVDATFWASFADDTEMGCFVPRVFNLQKLGGVADLTLPSE